MCKIIVLLYKKIVMIDIKRVLKDKKIEIVELAKILNVSRQTVHYYINQGNKNSVDTLEKIADALGISVMDLFNQPKKNTFNCPHCGNEIKIDSNN